MVCCFGEDMIKNKILIYVGLVSHNYYLEEKLQERNLSYLIQKEPFLLDPEYSSLIYFVRSSKNNPNAEKQIEEDWDSREAVF